MPGTFFFQRVCTSRFFSPDGENVVTAPYGVMLDSWMSVRLVVV
jgi:hypothetical protein